MRIPRIVDQIFDRVISWIEFMLSQVPKSGPRGTHGWYNNKRSETWRLGLCLAEGYILSSEEGCGIACGVTQRPQKCPVRRERSGQPAMDSADRAWFILKRNAPLSLSRLADHRVCGRAVDFKPGGAEDLPDRTDCGAERGGSSCFPLYLHMWRCIYRGVWVRRRLPAGHLVGLFRDGTAGGHGATCRSAASGA